MIVLAFVVLPLAGLCIRIRRGRVCPVEEAESLP